MTATSLICLDPSDVARRGKQRCFHLGQEFRLVDVVHLDQQFSSSFNGDNVYRLSVCALENEEHHAEWPLRWPEEDQLDVARVEGGNLF